MSRITWSADLDVKRAPQSVVALPKTMLARVENPLEVPTYHDPLGGTDTGSSEFGVVAAAKSLAKLTATTAVNAECFLMLSWMASRIRLERAGS